MEKIYDTYICTAKEAAEVINTQYDTITSDTIKLEEISFYATEVLKNLNPNQYLYNDDGDWITEELSDKFVELINQIEIHLIDLNVIQS